MTRDIGHQPGQEGDDGGHRHVAAPDSTTHDGAHETTPLLGDRSLHGDDDDDSGIRTAWWHRIPRSIASALLGSLRWFFSTLAAPGVYLIACFYDEAGHFAPLLPLKRLFMPHSKAHAYMDDDGSFGQFGEKRGGRKSPDGLTVDVRRSHASSALSSGSESETTPPPDVTTRTQRRRGSSRHSRSHHASSSSEEISPARRSIRIKLNDDALTQRKKARSPSTASSSSGHTRTTSIPPPAAVAAGLADLSGTDHSVQFKSPTSPMGALTRYPKTPAPPRPLVPRRSPSYLNLEPVGQKHQKTLILDLDETLIHSMSKGGRMNTGHMVEVRLSTTYVGHGGQTTIGPQHPILYWVNKRPHCDDFLRRVCKWYNLVIFTASVPEYADPVIDWLEQERKFFSGRYYRQHCTFRQGAFIKDLSSVEPDLSKVMILDNSPLSYMFHQDNAIPIQGWINDPTDNDLLHLVPLLEGLQYVSDVRALLALRGGEEGQHMA